MNTMMLALLQGRLWDTAATLQQRLQGLAPRRDKASLAHWDATESQTPEAMESELSQVYGALDLLHEGRYGYCKQCERPLEPDELLIKPYRLLCPDCQDASPLGAAMQQRAGGRTLPNQ
jgi:RNA polymerase-binding transcription factor DksA